MFSDHFIDVVIPFDVEMIGIAQTSNKRNNIDLVGENPTITTQEIHQKIHQRIHQIIHQKKWDGKTIQIIGLLKANPRLSRKDLQTVLKLNDNAVKYRLSKLQKEGVIRRVGPDKGGYWEVTEG